LEIRVEPDLPRAIETDSQRLEQVLKNLLANAIKFTEEGRVELAVGRAADGRLSFAVTDTGIGIPEDQQDSIFEPFRQGDSALNRKFAGTGLGLSICRELVRLLGGEIRVTSVVNGGSTFTVLLPEHQDRSAVQRRREEYPRVLAATASTGRSAAPPAVSKTRAPAAAHADDDRERLTGDKRVILVVEDDLSFANILRDLTHELGFQCLIANSSAEALALAAQYSPSAAILDVGLPDASGLSVLDRLKLDARTRHIPVHIVSVHDYAETALSLGAVGYALKPV
jgi:CheY-like chemotaxis protein